MCKYLSEVRIKTKIAFIRTENIDLKRRILQSIKDEEFLIAHNLVSTVQSNNAEIDLLNDLLLECEEIKINFDNLVEECNKQKQCKDCEEFVESVSMTENCTECSFAGKNCKGLRCPQLGFCKKHEKFVDEYTECLDEEE